MRQTRLATNHSALVRPRTRLISERPAEAGLVRHGLDSQRPLSIASLIPTAFLALGTYRIRTALDDFDHLR